MVSDRKLASSMAAKTARACDNCIKKRARWYCPADDAFLCQNCDSSVHSANPLARRHERVRLKTSSLKEQSSDDFPNLWHRGIKRKARTPRNGRKVIKIPLYLVPEILSDENSVDENEEQLLYRVPIFDPLMAGTNVMENIDSNKEVFDLNRFHHGSLPSEMEFAADVESLLGKGLDDESFDMEGLGFLGSCNNKDENSVVSEKVKVEDEGEMEVRNFNQFDIDITGDTFEFKFDYDDYEEEDNKGEVVMRNNSTEDAVAIGDEKKISLNLDYESVLTAWADQRCPWTNGERPELDSNDCWSSCMGNCGTIGEIGIMKGHGTVVDRGREARVSRYREKRRTRLFSKKIRYEVRKLNAEKRPRMKGRFVKRANFSTAPPPCPLLNK